MNTQSLSGTITQHQIKCTEMPFFVNNNGDICYRENENIILKVSGHDCNTLKSVLQSLNQAYKLGYEMDRVEWR